MFLSRSNRDLHITVHGELEEYELLEVLEFDSTRKRMSVIVRCPDNRIRVFTKGADSVIFDRLSPGEDPSVTAQHLHDFAVEGLRTLCLAYADLDEHVYAKWKLRYMQASSRVNGREDAVAAIAEEVERNLTLIGATAIEDKLQEGVPETLRKLEQASVKVWVLTGDKQETAINIGLSCGAIEDGMDVYIINEDNLEDTAAQIDCAIGRWKALLHDPGMERKLGLVIDGQTLHFALRTELQVKLMHLARMARSVIACRVSPKQKTELVELVRRHEKDKVTLAIGDGANDVGMIQAAHVGVGIVGLEGQEAKLASDFSIGQFRFLARLMLVHGRWNYKRLSKMVLYTVYKNMTLTMCELYWATFSAYTGQPLLDPWMSGVYNLFSTSLPPIVMGILDQELSAEYALAFPEIYVKGQRNTAYSVRVFLYWMASAAWQSALIFYTVVGTMGGRPQSNGQDLGMWSFGVVIFTVVIIVVHVLAFLYQSAWTRVTLGVFMLSFASWFIIGPLFSTEPISLTSDFAPGLFGVTHRVLPTRVPGS
jgi:phospholipid-transporting ATPase